MFQLTQDLTQWVKGTASNGLTTVEHSGHNYNPMKKTEKLIDMGMYYAHIFM